MHGNRAAPQDVSGRKERSRITGRDARTHAGRRAPRQTHKMNWGGEYIIVKCSHGHHHGNKRCAIVLQGTSCNKIIAIFCRIIVLSSRAEEEEDRLRVSEEAGAGPAPEEERGMETCFIFYIFLTFA